MSILKKWIGCVVSFVAGVLGLSLSACSGMIVAGKIDASALSDSLSKSSNEITKAFKVITDGSLYTQAKELGIGTQFVWMKVFAIITLVASVLLIVYSIVALLQNVNVIKSSHIAFDIVGISLVALLLVATIGLMITSNIYANAFEMAYASTLTNIYSQMLPTVGIPAESVSLIKFDIVAKVGVYQIAMLVVAIVATIVNSIFTFLKRKSA